jgi:Tol biopolymer transport system component
MALCGSYRQIPGPTFPEARIRSRRFALLAVLAVGGCAHPAPPPVGAPRNAVYVPAEPGERHLANIRQLTFGGNNAEAYFSADGQRLIFQHKDSVDKNTGCDQEYVMNIDGSGMRRVSNGRGRTTCGYFIEHDQRILYSSTFADSPACPAVPDPSLGYVWPLGRFEIYSARPDGSDLRQLTRTGSYNAETTASPDGRHLIFTSTRDGDIDLYTMDVDGRNVKRITSRIGYDGGAFFSPDGREIVWRASYPATAADSADYRRLFAEHLVRPAALELWTAHADGSGAHQVTHLGGANWAPYFFPDGKRIVFASNYRNPRSGNFDLYEVRTDGTGLEQITTSTEFDGFPMFSPDGRKLVWVSSRHGREQGEINLFIADWKD